MGAVEGKEIFEEKVVCRKLSLKMGGNDESKTVILKIRFYRQMSDALAQINGTTQINQ